MRAVLHQQMSVALAPVDHRGRAPCARCAEDGAARGAAAAGTRGGAAVSVAISASCSSSAARAGASSTHLEADAVARRELADLPQIGLDHHERADEPAQRRAVGPEDDRHVAGEVDGPDGVGVVVDVRGVQSRLAAVAPRPARACGPIRRTPVRLEL